MTLLVPTRAHTHTQGQLAEKRQRHTQHTHNDMGPGVLCSNQQTTSSVFSWQSHLSLTVSHI